jgi:hypothetical protein
MANNPTQTQGSEDLQTFLGTDLFNGIQDYLACRESHSPLPCYMRTENSECVLKTIQPQWRSAVRLTPERSSPQVFELIQAGCDPNVARMIMSEEGFGMLDVSAVAKAYRTLQDSSIENPPPAIGVCFQCGPGTNTYCWKGKFYTDTCHRVRIDVARFSARLESDARILCIGDGGKLEFRRPGEFMAISHVWEHGWQGVSEDGICSRTLNYLLQAAKSHGVDWIWLDVAIISGQQPIRTMSVNSMNRVYTSAKVTLICDRLILSMHGGSSRQKTLILAACDWMTRVWTMQEALLSKKLVFAQGESYWDAEQLIQKLLFEDELTNWQVYRAVRTLFSLVEMISSDKEVILERIMLISKERRTTKAVDLARALYPLFGLLWPGPNTSLVQGQIRLLEHLEGHAARCAGLFGPIGLPSPWSWAPFCLPGCSGGLQGHGRLLTPDGLMGAWSSKEVKPTNRQALDSRTGHIAQNNWWETFTGEVASSFAAGTGALLDNLQNFRQLLHVPKSLASDLHRAAVTTTTGKWTVNSHARVMAHLTGGRCDVMDFVDKSGLQFMRALVYYSEAEPYPWAGARLFLLSSSDTFNTLGVEHFDLVIVRSSEAEWYLMHRVASVFGQSVEMTGQNMSIQGILC